MDLESGSYGTFKVLMDGKAILEGGALGFLGILPTAQTIREKIREAAESGKSRPFTSVKGGA